MQRPGILFLSRAGMYRDICRVDAPEGGHQRTPFLRAFISEPHLDGDTKVGKLPEDIGGLEQPLRVWVLYTDDGAAE